MGGGTNMSARNVFLITDHIGCHAISQNNGSKGVYILHDVGAPTLIRLH